MIRELLDSTSLTAVTLRIEFLYGKESKVTFPLTPFRDQEVRQRYHPRLSGQGYEGQNQSAFYRWHPHLACKFCGLWT